MRMRAHTRLRDLARTGPAYRDSNHPRSAAARIDVPVQSWTGKPDPGELPKIVHLRDVPPVLASVCCSRYERKQRVPLVRKRGKESEMSATHVFLG